MGSDCGGCRGEGRHTRWCSWAVGLAAAMLGKAAESAESLADRVGANNTGAANHLYAASGLLRDDANSRAAEYQARHGRSH